MEVNGGRIFTDVRSIEINIHNLLFTEIEDNNCISIYEDPSSLSLTQRTGVFISLCKHSTSREVDIAH